MGLLPKNNNLEKLMRNAQHLAPEKKQYWRSNWFDKAIKEKKKKPLIQVKKLILLEILKFPLLTIAHALNHWSTDKMRAFMNQHCWGNINKATKSPSLACPTCPKCNPGKHFCTVPGHFEMPYGPFKVWQVGFT